MAQTEINGENELVKNHEILYYRTKFLIFLEKLEC